LILEPLIAYIGPGAGIAVLGSFLAVLAGFLSAFFALLTWPLRAAWRWRRSRKARRRAQVKRVVILGLDGLDPGIVNELLKKNALPHLAALRDEGSYTPLGTTWPPLSPVAWSSFSTGANPGKHHIFDFLDRNPANYGGRISSIRIEPARRNLDLGPFRIPLSKPRFENLRKSKPFWKILGEAGIFSAVLRVPISFPPDKFYGVQLSAMCVPDLRGTQGTFFYFTEHGDEGLTSDGELGGERRRVTRDDKNIVHGTLLGPENPLRIDHKTTTLPFHISRDPKKNRTLLQIDGQKIPLPPNEFTDWFRVRFPLAPGIIARALFKCFLKSFDEPFELYATPLNIDPAKPIMPISHPKAYSVYLAKQLGDYATLGLAEDTWSVSEGIMTEEAFLQEAYSIDNERRQMFFDALETVPRGLVTCVFDAPDRIQHVFWRFHDENHPAQRDCDPEKIAAHKDTIRDMYRRMDKLVGETRKRIGNNTTLLVMSDHGFKNFRRGVDLNAWLLANGYLHLLNDVPASGKSYLEEVDWNRTRAYALGLAGIFINEQNRESNGIVAPGSEKENLVQELCQKLTSLQDNEHHTEAIHASMARESVYHGPYVEDAPDIIIGYQVGYRVSWDSAVGKCGPAIFADNTKAWSGDHCIHPHLVPGILFSNRNLPGKEHANIVDLAPTALELLGVEPPSFMDGKSLL
jgi:predicted AlkP superfamily phosphohydrolase/phosphomutase